MSRRMWQRGPDGEIVRAAPPPPDGCAEAPEQPRRANLWIAVRLGARDTYDYLGSMVVLSAAVFFLTSAAVTGAVSLGARFVGGLPGALPFLLLGLAGSAAVVVIGAPLTAGLFRFCLRTAARQEPELFDLAWGFRSALGRNLGLGALQVFGVLVLAGNMVFYLAQRNLALMALGASLGYLLLFWLAAMQYQWPLLIEQDARPLAVVRKSALLVLDNPPFSFLLLGVCLLVAALMALTVVGAVLILPGALAMLATQATREILRKYGLLPPDPTLDPIATEVGP